MKKICENASFCQVEDDLDTVAQVIDSLEPGREKFLHITLSFKEKGLSADFKREIVEEFRQWAFEGVAAENATQILKRAAIDARNSMGYGADQITYAAREARELIAREVAQLTAGNVLLKRATARAFIAGAIAIGIGFTAGVVVEAHSEIFRRLWL